MSTLRILHSVQAAIAGLLLLPGAVWAGELHLAPIFQDQMVLQREMRLPVWGRGVPGERVEVQLHEQKKTATVSADGAWRVHLDPEKAGGPHRLTIRQGAQEITRSDLLVGDVWVCSGQSNMEWQVRRSSDAENEIRNASHPRIRLYTPRQQTSHQPLDNMKDTGGKWVPCSPDTVGDFSAIAYFFGRDLQQNLGVPIGLINASIGATKIQAWMSREAMQRDEAARVRLAKFDALASDPEIAKQVKAFEQTGARARVLARETREAAADGWMLSTKETDGWQPLDELLSEAASSGREGPESILMDLRIPVKIPPEWIGKEIDIRLSLRKGTAVAVFLDGQKAVYQSGSRANPLWIYRVPASQGQAGERVLAVRCFARQHDAAWQELFHQSALSVPDSQDRLALGKGWSVRVVERFPFLNEPLHPGAFRATLTGAFNGMIHPLMPFGIKGVIWYQGESDSSSAGAYRRLLSLLIPDWRSKWGVGDFPFLIVQLPNRGPLPTAPDDPAPWAFFREAQAATAKEIPNVGLAVTIDIGVADQLHPLNKQDFGKRLALTARGVAYGERVAHQGPLYRAMNVEGNRIRISFDHADGLAPRQAGPIHGFVVAGADRKFFWAEAKIEGTEVVVSSAEVPHPVAVRYAWSGNPENAILTNREGLPAMPFRSDQW